MNDDHSALNSARRKPRKLFYTALAAAALLATGGAVTYSAVSSYTADTERRCEVALSGMAAAVEVATVSTAEAAIALEAVVSTELPDGAGSTTAYADRVAVEGRVSGASRIAVVTDSNAVLTKAAAAAPTACVHRDEATKLPAKSARITSSATALDDDVNALLADFTEFQADEAARIAAEAEVARIAAEAEAARVAAEQAAAEAAAEAERNSYSGGGGGSVDDGGYRGSTGTPGGGGGNIFDILGIEIPDGPTVCLGDNGVGGTYVVPC